MSATHDLQTGIVTAYAANAALVALVPVSRFSFGTNAGSPTMPYIVARVTKGGETELYSTSTTGGPLVITKRVVFSVYATTAATASNVVAAIFGAFKTQFAVPNSQHLDWRIDDDAIEELPIRTSGGEQVYEGRAEFLSTLVRVLP